MFFDFMNIFVSLSLLISITLSSFSFSDSSLPSGVSCIHRLQGLTASSVGIDSDGHIYIAGGTTEKLEEESYGGADAFLSKHDRAGSVVWRTLIGTEYEEYGGTLAVTEDNFIYVGGTSRGNLDGNNSGNTDVFLRKYNSLGELVWADLFGSREADWPAQIVLSDNAVYVIGTTLGRIVPGSGGVHDVFVRKYNHAGEVIWTKQLGSYSQSEFARGGVIDNNGFIYVASDTTASYAGSNLGGRDALVIKLNSNGTVIWSKQLGTTENEESSGITVDSEGYVYVIGKTGGDFGIESPNPPGYEDPFLFKLDSDGNLVWVRQWGKKSHDQAGSVTLLGNNLWVSGFLWDDVSIQDPSSMEPFFYGYSADGDFISSIILSSSTFYVRDLTSVEFESISTILFVGDFFGQYGPVLGSLGEYGCPQSIYMPFVSAINTR